MAFSALVKSGAWQTQRKPLPRRFQFDPGGVLSAGCQLALLWDYGGSAILNYAAPSMALATSGTVTSGSSQYGGTVLTTGGSAAFVQLTPGLAAPVVGYTISALVLFTGAAPVTATNKLMTDTGSTQLLGAATTGFLSAANVTAAVIKTQNFSTWTRIVVTYDQVQTAHFYANGALVETPAAVGGVVLGPNAVMGDTGLARSWGFAVADMFYWNRMLSAPEVAYQYAKPYQSVLRPVASLRWRGQQTPLPGLRWPDATIARPEVVSY